MLAGPGLSLRVLVGQVEGLDLGSESCHLWFETSWITSCQLFVHVGASLVSCWHAWLGSAIRMLLLGRQLDKHLPQLSRVNVQDPNQGATSEARDPWTRLGARLRRTGALSRPAAGWTPAGTASPPASCCAAR